MERIIIPYGRQTIDDQDIEAVVNSLKSNSLTQGGTVSEFENQLAKYCGAKYAVVFNNGTAALQAAYNCAGVGDGDEIISTSLTFSATTNAALWFRATPVFADIDSVTGNINLEYIKNKVSTKTKVIVPVDFAGNPVDIEPIIEFAKCNNLIVIQDGCHSLGASYKGKKIGSLADITTFSFHPVKSITTGEGGALVTDNFEYYKSAIRFRSHGIVKENFINPSNATWYQEMQVLGLNLRLTDFQCALGISQLKKLDNFIKRRQEIADIYLNAFNNLNYISCLNPIDKTQSSWHLFVIVLSGPYEKFRNQIFEKLRLNGIGVQLHYIPVYKHPYYSQIGYKPGLCPNSENLTNKIISLPIYPNLTDNDQKYVIDSIKSILQSIDENSFHS
jgi:perosamine synthetase